MSGARLPSVSDVIRWYAQNGLRPVLTIDYAARKVTVRPKADNDASEGIGLEPTDTLAENIRKAFGEG